MTTPTQTVTIDQALLERIESAFNSGLAIPSSTPLRTAIRAALQAAPVQPSESEAVKLLLEMRHGVFLPTWLKDQIDAVLSAQTGDKQ